MTVWEKAGIIAAVIAGVLESLVIWLRGTA
jgi:hypothetical protein